MNFIATPLKGAYVLDSDAHVDERGSFARIFCIEEFRAQGLETHVAQCSTSFTKRRGTLRGMHYQVQPYAECKLIRCTAGSIYDVIVDLRPESPTYKHWYAIELSARNRRLMYVPKGFAHGFQALEDSTEVFYMISAPYDPASARGVPWDDPSLAIDWPISNPIVHERDMGFPRLGR